MNFAEATQYLLSLGHETLAMKLGLRNTELLLEQLDRPHQSYEVVQIAGTNGKGSTAVMLDSICRAAGISSGLYTSPHLVSITERIRINGDAISEAEFAKSASAVRSAAEDLLSRGLIEALPTFFEHVTAIALLAFRSAGIKIAILETGLGGRLDATTVAEAATVAITPVSLDHQEYLGETLQEIASEKAAIIRSGVTAIVAPQSEVVRQVVLQRCHYVNVDPVIDGCHYSDVSATTDGHLQADFETSNDRYEQVLLGLRGRHQLANAAVAVQLAEALRTRGFVISKAAILTGLKTAEHPGRLSFLGKSLLLDGAHNAAAARALRDYLVEFVPPPVTLVFGAMRDKPIEEMAAILFPRVHRLILTEPANLRAASVESLEELAKEFLTEQSLYLVPRVVDALKLAHQITPPGGTICVTGSLYLVGEVMATEHASSATPDL